MHGTFYFQLALSAASPVHRGYLSDIDTRWPVLSQSFDDRTDEEKGQKVCKMHPNNCYRQKIMQSVMNLFEQRDTITLHK